MQIRFWFLNALSRCVWPDQITRTGIAFCTVFSDRARRRRWRHCARWMTYCRKDDSIEMHFSNTHRRASAPLSAPPPSVHLFIGIKIKTNTAKLKSVSMLNKCDVRWAANHRCLRNVCWKIKIIHWHFNSMVRSQFIVPTKGQRIRSHFAVAHSHTVSSHHRK